MIILMIIITSFIIYKLSYILQNNKKFDKYFNDMTVLTERYALLHYFFNNIRTLLIFPKDDIIKIFEEPLENINIRYEEQNIKYNDILTSNIGDYKEIKKLFDLLKESIREVICKDIAFCENYLVSEENILGPGIDFTYKTIITEFSNIYMDYKKIINKTDIEEVKSTLITSKDSQFFNIGLCLYYFYLYVEQKILECFEKDETTFTKTYLNTMTLLNIVSIFFSVFIFFFIVIFTFISISNFTQPIKDSTFRINNSFYFIKKYSLKNYRKCDSNLAEF